MSKANDIINPTDALLAELRGMIAEAREQVAQVANAALTMLYWRMGQRIHRDILGEKRADYGKRIVASLRRQLAAEFGAGFGEKNLRTAISKKPEEVAKADYKGKMELYLRWPARHEQQPGEESPLGIILCAGKKEEQIELLKLGHSGIHVAEYLTALPPRELLQQELHDAIKISQARLEAKQRETE